MTRNRIVFITQEGPHDYTPAEEYGDVNFLTRHEWSPFDTSLRNANTLKEIKHRLRNYAPMVDYIVPAGSPIIMVIIGMLLKEYGSKHKLLHWNNQTRKYNEITIDFDKLEQIEG